MVTVVTFVVTLVVTFIVAPVMWHAGAGVADAQNLDGGERWQHTAGGYMCDRFRVVCCHLLSACALSCGDVCLGRRAGRLALRRSRLASLKLTQ